MISINKQSGFSVLFASLIGSLVLAIGIAILSITIKQLTLASAGRESQKAFYAADTGSECALFLDRGGGNAECSSVFPNNDQGTLCGIDTFIYECAGVELNDNDSNTNDAIFIESWDAQSATTRIQVKNISNSENICFDVSVTKTENTTDGGYDTEIVSRGFSTCNENSTNRFERAIKTTK